MITNGSFKILILSTEPWWACQDFKRILFLVMIGAETLA